MSKPKIGLEDSRLLDIQFGKLKYKNNDYLLEQFVEACWDDSIRFILIVSGRIIDSRLRTILVEIAKLKKKKLTHSNLS